MAQGTALFMSISLLRALTKYYDVVEMATTNSAIVAPSGLDFVPGPGDDLESMIWVFTYALMLHHQASLKGSDRADYKRDVVDNFYGTLSYSGLAEKRTFLAVAGINPRSRGPEAWIPDPVHRKWFRRAMALVASQIMPSPDGSIIPITFDAFDKLCEDFTTND